MLERFTCPLAGQGRFPLRYVPIRFFLLEAISVGPDTRQACHPSSGVGSLVCGGCFLSSRNGGVMLPTQTKWGQVS